MENVVVEHILPDLHSDNDKPEDVNNDLLSFALGNHSSPRENLRLCFICSSEGSNLTPLKDLEMDTVAKFFFGRNYFFTLRPPSDFLAKLVPPQFPPWPSWRTKLKIFNIAASLHALISSRNSLFNKLQNDFSGTGFDLVLIRNVCKFNGKFLMYKH